MVGDLPTSDAGAMSTTELPPAPPPPPAGPSGPRVSADDARNLGRLRRTLDGSPYGRHVAGVSGGIARHFDVDPVLVRVLMVVLTLFGPGVFVYVGLWLLVPTEDERPATIRLSDSTRNLVLWVGGAIAASATLASTVAPWQGDRHWWGFGPWPWILVALVITVPAWRRRGTDGTDGTDGTGRGDHGDHVGGDAPGDQAASGGPGPAGIAPEYRYQPAPRPRRTGPVLFWPTLAVIALAEGALGVADLAGLSTVPAAYPAVAVGIVAVALVVGAFWGRAGGLIAVGLVGVLATLAATAAHEIHGSPDTVVAPRTPAAVAATYDGMGIGHFDLDLTGVRSPRQLDGRVIHVSGHVGYLEIEVPSSWGVDFTGRVDGAGQIATSGPDSDSSDGSGGTHAGWSHEYAPATAHDPTVTVDASLGFGLIQLRRIP
jgi:phage shock protein PspC (stress-responsive transcriptional regulator)